MPKDKLKRFTKSYSIIFLITMIIFIALFINEVLIQPYNSQKAADQAKNLYQKASNLDNTTTIKMSPTPTSAQSRQKTELDSAPSKDEEGRLLQFKDLLTRNEEVKGWITIPDTNIDYVVMQSDEANPEYYLSRNMLKENDKAGCLFLDYKSSVENDSKNLVVHGHNMTSTDNMFHYLLSFKNLDYYKTRPVLTFDTIFQTGKWKIFAIIITNGSSKNEKLFDYTKAEFANSSEFLNFVYQLRIRSIYNISTVDLNEDDQLLTLSTCSYEIEDYRTAIIARRIREGEDPTVDVESITLNQHPLYPLSWYKCYGGEAPKVTTFEEALKAGEIDWYTQKKTKDKE